jgi:hypothetical protein
MQECLYCQKEYNNLRDHFSFLWRQSLTWIQIRVDPRWILGSLDPDPYLDKKLDLEPQHLLCLCRNAPTARRSTTICATISGLVTLSSPGGDSALTAHSQAATPRRFQISGVISGTGFFHCLIIFCIPIRYHFFIDAFFLPWYLCFSIIWNLLHTGYLLYLWLREKT